MTAQRFVFVLFAVLVFCTTIQIERTHAQYLPNICPPPARWVNNGGGYMCQCPNGSYLSLGQGCGYSRPQQPVGQYCANGGTCPVGSRCSWMPGRCVPIGMVDCGSYYCRPGNKCFSGGGCLPQESQDCGGGRYCSQGTICWTARADIPGVVRRGEVKCPTAEQAAQLNARIAELAEERRRRIKEEREAKRRAAEERKAEAKRKREKRRAEAKRKREEAKRKREERRAEARRKAKERRVEAKRKREEARKKRKERSAEIARRRAQAKLDRKLRATMNNRRASIVERKIAAIALGEDPDKIKGGLRHRAGSNAALPHRRSAAERKLAEIAMGKVKLRNTYKQPTSSDAMLRAVMNNPKESVAARKIAAIGLGLDANSIGAKPSQANSPANYSFSPTRYGTVEVSRNGQRIATVTPALATSQYGYRPGTVAVPTPVRSNSGRLGITTSARVGNTPTAAVPPPSSAQSQQSKNLWNKLGATSKSLSSTKLPSEPKFARGIANLSARKSASTFSAQPKTLQVVDTRTHAEKLANLKQEAQQSAARYGLSINPKVAAQVLPYARMSQDAYSTTGNPIKNERRISDWQTILKSSGYSDRKIRNIERAGFYASVYRNDRTGEITIAYRGTDPSQILGPDGRTDLNAHIAGTIRKFDPNYVDPQYAAAADLAKIVKQKWPAGTPISLTGHSLGGGLASYAGGQNNISNVVTFNAARNIFSTSPANSKQLNIVVPGEFIGDPNTGAAAGRGSLPGQHYGVRSTTDAPGVTGDLFGAHGMDGLIGGLQKECNC